MKPVEEHGRHGTEGPVENRTTTALIARFPARLPRTRPASGQKDRPPTDTPPEDDPGPSAA
jgi:hypothetical protein